MAGSVAIYKMNPYELSVWNKKQALQKKQNALDLQQIQQDEAAYKTAAQQSADLANQGWARYQLGYGANLTNLTNNTNSQALQMGNARGSWARDYIAGGAERKALDTGLTQAQEDWRRSLSDIDYQAQQNALGIADRMSAYNLGLESQAASDWAQTHYYKAPAAARPIAPTTPTFARPGTAPNINDYGSSIPAYSVAMDTYKKQQAAWDKYDQDYLKYKRAGGA